MEEEGVDLGDVLRYIEQALRGDRRLSNQLFWQFQRLASLTYAPPEERALGVTLGRILLGDRQPDLSKLDPEAAEEIRAFLTGLGEK